MSEEFKNALARIIPVQPDGKVVLNLRPGWSKLASEKWQLVGGRFNPGEEVPELVAERQMDEELGAKIDPEELILFMESLNEGWLSYVFIVFLQQEIDLENLPPHGKFDEARAFTPGEILQLIDAGEVAFEHPDILIKFLDYLAANPQLLATNP